MSRPPEDRERRVMYTGFALPGGDYEGDKLSAIRDGAPQRMGRESTGELGRVGRFDLA